MAGITDLPFSLGGNLRQAAFSARLPQPELLKLNSSLREREYRKTQHNVDPNNEADVCFQCPLRCSETRQTGLANGQVHFQRASID